jgi:diguanylate cyclase (GGDEF)-like protein/PAS domain S-box-containing protein
MKDKYKTKDQLINEIEKLRRQIKKLQRATKGDKNDGRFMLLLEKAFKTTRTGITIRDLNNKILFANPAEAEMHGYTVDELLGRNANIFAPPGSVKPLTHDEMNSMESWSRESINVRKNGSFLDVYLISDVVKNDDGRPIGIVTLCEDLSERKDAEEKIRYLAHYDNLTGLPNRTLFKELLEKALLHAKRSGQIIAVLYIDVDHFKRVNDTFGHDVGDGLLKGITRTLLRSIRKSDSAARFDERTIQDTLSHLGGDEFILLLNGLISAQDAAKIASRLLNDMNRPFNLRDQEIIVTVSVGISLYPADGDGVESLLKNADAAMHYAKKEGRNNYQFFSESMNKLNLERLTIENDLRRALYREQLMLYYQPILDVSREKLTGLEAVVRWKHHKKGTISPGNFIPIAEETGLIVPIGEWIIRTACTQNKAWQIAGLSPIRVAVNLSSRQFEQPDLVDIVSRALYDSKLEPQYLELEITESTLMKYADRAIANLEKLKGMGIKISIDDFGTGYSSLNYLSRIPLDSLKIDRSFVKQVRMNPNDEAIITAIIGLAHNLRLKVVAEGVETESQLAFLREHRCDEVQGYLWSPPLPTEDIISILTK